MATKILRALFVLAAFASVTGCATNPIFVAPDAEGKPAAIRGYDAVGYRTDGKPVVGRPEFTHRWQGADWRFASAANRDTFASEPQRYAPQYGGYCAYGAANGFKVSTEPAAFTIDGGKLYLNYSIPVRNTWNKDRARYIQKADAKWPTLAGEAYETEEKAVARTKAKQATRPTGTDQP